jgi:hypothetical protein
MDHASKVNDHNSVDIVQHLLNQDPANVMLRSHVNRIRIA